MSEHGHRGDDDLGDEDRDGDDLGRDDLGGNGIDRDAVPEAGAPLIEIVAEDDAARDGAESIEASAAEAEPKTVEQLRIGALEAELDDAHAKLRQYGEAVDHARREFAASRARLEREHGRTMEDHKAKLVQGLLGVADTLDSALNGAGDGGAAFIDGVKIVRSEFEKALADLGLTRFDPIGDLFDPERHDALTMIPVADVEHDGRVVQVVHFGAMVGEKVLRPASVVVGKCTPKSEPTAPR